MECTKCIYWIKYSKNISFCESEIIKNDYGDYFNDINGTTINDLNEIREKIKNLNNEGSFKSYNLYAPIEALESIPNKENIELIDLPGIKESIMELNIDLEGLIKMSDGFIFNFNSVNIVDNNSQYIFTQIIEYIKTRNDCYDFKNCLFNLNYIDQIEDNLIDEKVEEFKSEISKTINRNIYTGNFIDKLAMKEKILSSNYINVSYISNLFYQHYQENIDKIETLKFITNDAKLEDIYEDLNEDYFIEELIEENNLETLDEREIEKNGTY